MKSKYISLGLATLGFICASGLSFQHLSFLHPAAKLQIQPAQAEQVILPNLQKVNQNRRKLIRTKLNSEFSLKVRQTAIVARENLRISFVKVSEDSRCPANAFCIWAGQAKVVLNVVKDGQNLGEVVLTKGAGDPALAVQKVADKYTIKLVDVQPYPVEPLQIQQSDYVITLIVSKT